MKRKECLDLPRLSSHKQALKTVVSQNFPALKKKNVEESNRRYSPQLKSLIRCREFVNDQYYKKFYKTVNNNLEKLECHRTNLQNNSKRTNANEKFTSIKYSTINQVHKSINETKHLNCKLYVQKQKLINPQSFYQSYLPEMSKRYIPPRTAAYRGHCTLKYKDGTCCKKLVFFIPSETASDVVCSRCGRLNYGLCINNNKAAESSAIPLVSQRKLTLNKVTNYFINGIKVRPLIVVSSDINVRCQRYPNYSSVSQGKPNTAILSPRLGAVERPKNTIGARHQDPHNKPHHQPKSEQTNFLKKSQKMLLPRSRIKSSSTSSTLSVINFLSCWKCFNVQTGDESSTSIESEDGSGSNDNSCDGGGGGVIEEEDFNQIEDDAFDHLSDGGDNSAGSSLSLNQSIYEECAINGDLIYCNSNENDGGDEYANEMMYHDTSINDGVSRDGSTTDEEETRGRWRSTLSPYSTFSEYEAEMAQRLELLDSN